HQQERHFRTRGGLHVSDITDEVAEIARDSGGVDGTCCVYSPHTTCCVRVNEFETGFFEDFARLLRRLIPDDTYYAHDDWDRRTENICPEDMEFGNGHAHCMSMLLGSAGESIPVAEGDLALGTWQRILFMELDRERDRRWRVKVVGSGDLAAAAPPLRSSRELHPRPADHPRGDPGPVRDPAPARADPRRPLPPADRDDAREDPVHAPLVRAHE